MRYCDRLVRSELRHCEGI